MAPNIPKFSSFRPKPKEPEQKPSPVERHKHAETSDKEKRKEREREGERQPKHVPEPSTRHHVPAKSSSTVYFTDRRGDRDIVRYGCLDRYKTPPYRRYGCGYVLGLSRDYRIDREESNDRRIVLSGPRSRRPERLLASKRVATDPETRLRFVKPVAELPSDTAADFIELAGSRKRKRADDFDPEDADYRTIEGPKDRQNPDDSDLEYESESEGEQPQSEVTRKNSELIQRTRTRPEDIEAWLQLAQHQEAMMTLGRASPELNALDRRNLAEIRISIYEQALHHVYDDQDGVIQLYLGLMTEASRTWNEEKVAIKWQDILEKFPSCSRLWLNYLDFVQGAVATFKYERCRQAYHRCLKTLQASPDKGYPDAFLHILTRLTAMIKDSGYQEFSLAIWQAVLQLHLLPLEAVGESNVTDEILQKFEEFWESEVPRLGEAGAKGWHLFKSESSVPPDPVVVALASSDPSAPIFKDFSRRETDHMLKLSCPGRTLDDTGEDDPFHLVFFSDIEQYLRILPPYMSGSTLLDAFLCFAGMPPLPELGSNRRPWRSDPFLRSRKLLTHPHSSADKAFKQTLNALVETTSGFETTIGLLLDYCFPHSSQFTAPHLGVVRQVLDMSTLDEAIGEAAGEYLLAFEHVYFPADAVKTAKRLIKGRPASRRLYRAYGLVEARRGNHSKAEQVFSAALSIRNSGLPTPAPEDVELVTCLVWQTLSQGDNVKAMWHMTSLSGSHSGANAAIEKPDQTSLLRVRTLLTTAQGSYLVSRRHSAAVLANSLLALLAYLSTDGDPHAAFAEYERLQEWLLVHALSDSPAAELHAQHISQLLVYHATHAPIVKRALIRNALEPLISRFPTNTYLLSVYAANEARFSIDDRVRGVVQQHVLAQQSRNDLTAWFFAISYEMYRGEIAGSTSHSIRALFKKAEESDVGQHCPALWKSHVLFEVSEYEKDVRRLEPTERPRRERYREGRESKRELRLKEVRARVKDTFFQGLTRLPWCKEYAMLAFTTLQDKGILTEEELRRVYNMMLEKEMRVYVDISA